jgi:hypothetical protein
MKPLPKYLKVVGSTARGKDKPNDLDLLSVDKPLDQVLKYLQDHFNISQVNRKGDKILTVHMRHGKNTHKLNIWFTPKKDLPFMLLSYSYPKQFNIAMRKKAKTLGLTLNQYGLFKGDHKLPVNTIKGVFKKLKIAYRTPKAEEKKLFGSGIKDYLFKTVANQYRKRNCQGKARQLLDGEKHLQCANYCGPQTRVDLDYVRNYPPYNDVDNVCRNHDIDYLDCNKIQNDKLKANCIRQADDKMLKDLENYKDQEGYLLGKYAITAKEKFENFIPSVAKWISPGHFGQAGGDIPINKKHILNTKPKDSYTEDVKNAVRLISYNPEHSKIYGSYSYASQPYPGDIDVIEELSECCDKETAIKKLTVKLQNLLRKISTNKESFIGDIKSGVDSDIFQLAQIQKAYEKSKPTKNNKDMFRKTMISKLNELLHKGYMQREDINVIENLLKSKLSYADREALFNSIRSKFILRWTPDEIFKGFKKLPGNRIKFLSDAVQEKDSITKYDLWHYFPSVNKYLEMTNLFVLIYYDKNGHKEVINTTQDLINDLKLEVTKYYNSQIFFKPFKMAKRIYVLSRLFKDRNTALKLVELFRSDLGILNQINSELETVNLMLKNIDEKVLPLKQLKMQLDAVKQKIAIVINVEIDSQMIYKDIDKIVHENIRPEQIGQILDHIHDYLKKIINKETLKYLKKVKLFPPPNKYMHSNPVYWDR